MKKYPVFFALLSFLALSLASCKNTATFTLLADNSISFELDCSFEQNGPIQKLLESVGTDFNQLNLEELREGLLEEGFKSVEYSKLSLVAIDCIKQLQSKINELEKRIVELVKR